MPFCPCTRLMGHCQELQGWANESDSSRCPIGSEGGRSFVHAEVLDLYQTLAWGAGWLGLGKVTSLCRGGVQIVEKQTIICMCKIKWKDKMLFKVWIFGGYSLEEDL